MGRTLSHGLDGDGQVVASLALCVKLTKQVRHFDRHGTGLGNREGNPVGRRTVAAQPFSPTLCFCGVFCMADLADVTTLVADKRQLAGDTVT